jgi:isopropylmalate/homocitrate/citramalate synthase
MIEFIPGRRYIVHSAAGIRIGTFTGRDKGKRLKFRDCVRIVDAQCTAVLAVPDDQVLDAEPWAQSIDIPDTVEALDPAAHKQLAKRLKNRKAVVIERATPGKDW